MVYIVNMTTVVKGQPTSEEVRARLAALDEPVFLAFSCGKDSIAAWLAMQEAGIKEIIPVYLYHVPGLQFIEDQIAYFEDKFEAKIHQYPSPFLYRALNALMFQSPGDRLDIIEAAQLPSPSHAEIWDVIREELGHPDAWIADGVRAADSIVRRASFVRHGVMKEHSKKVSPVHDWLKAEVMGAIAKAGIQLPVDYEMFGRSFDGIDYRFIAPLRERFPEDYARICEWFPLAPLEFVRRGEAA